jgi:RNA polymerase sigma-70 factor (ECF subfamily)
MPAPAGQRSGSSIWRSLGPRAVDGDRSALGLLLETYRPLLMAIAERDLPTVLRPKVSPSDLVQKTCEDAVIGIPQLRATSVNQFHAWLTSLMANNVTDVERRFLASQKRCVYRECDESALAAVQRPDRNASPQEELLLAESIERLELALERLPIAHREILKWRYLESRSFQEFGQLVDRSEDAVRMMVNRSLNRLQREFAIDGSRL